MRLRTLFLVAVSLAALVGGLWYWRKTEAAAARRLETWEYEQRIEATEAVLERPADWPRQTLSLAELAQLVAKTSGLAVDIDRIALEAEGKNLPSITVDVSAGRLTTGSVLRLGLSPHELCYDISDRRLTITTPTVSRDRTRLRTVVHCLPQPVSGPLDEESWKQLIVTGIESSDWDEVGGKGHCEAVPGGLVIAHTSEAHRQIRRLIQTLETLGPDATRPVVLPENDFAGAAGRQRILAALDGAASLMCHDLPLAELVRQIEMTHHIPIVLGSKKLDEAGGFYRQFSITAQLDDLTLRSLLDHVLLDLRLTYVIRNGALFITHEDDGDYLPTLVAYPVGDLVEQGGPTLFDPLSDIITSTVARESWRDVGGAGSISTWGDGWLLISQSEPAHWQVEQFLQQIRSMLSGNSERASKVFGPDDNLRPSCWLYDVRALTDPDVGIVSTDGLGRLIQRTVSPESWDDAGGPAAMKYYRGLLVVQQTLDNHRELRLLLEALESEGLSAVSPETLESLEAVP